MKAVLYFLFGSHHLIDRGILWTGIASFFAFIAILIAWWQLGSLKKISQADFAKRFVDSFFIIETRTIFALLMNSALEFVNVEIKNQKGEAIDNLPCLKIRKSVANQLQGIVNFPEGKNGFSAFEIDDLLLGHFDDLGWYEKKNLIDIETIYQVFNYYITESWNNEEIKKYLGHRDNKGKYKDFKYINNRCVTYEKFKSICYPFQFLLIPAWKVIWWFKKIFLSK